MTDNGRIPGSDGNPGSGEDVSYREDIPDDEEVRRFIQRIMSRPSQSSPKSGSGGPRPLEDDEDVSNFISRIMSEEQSRDSNPERPLPKEVQVRDSTAGKRNEARKPSTIRDSDLDILDEIYGQRDTQNGTSKDESPTKKREAINRVSVAPDGGSSLAGSDSSEGFADLAFANIDPGSKQIDYSELRMGESRRSSMSGESGELSTSRPSVVNRGASIVHFINEDGEEVEMCEFEQDAFSLMFISEPTCRSFWFSLFVFGFQIFILSITILDLLEDPPGEEDDNLFNLPVSVEWQVSAAQVVALVIAISNQEELRTTLLLILVRYDKEITKEYPGATFWKFALSAFCRMVSGLLVIFVAFIFIVQSDNVLDIFLNFAAVEFVTSIDNLAFELASTGFLGSFMEEEAQKLEEVRLPITRSHLKWIVQTIFYGCLGLLFFGWVTVKGRQESGALLALETCGSFRFDFGDEFYVPPKGLAATFEDSFRAGRPQRFDLTAPPVVIYSFFSGDYVQQGSANGRPAYSEEGSDDPTAGKVYFCSDVLAWVFTIPALGQAIPAATRSGDCPSGFLARSPPTTSFTLDDAPLEGWKIVVGSTLVDTLDLSIVCNECEGDSDCGLFDGICDGGECQCKENVGGRFCNVPLPYCPSLEYIEYGSSSVEYYDSGPYTLLKDGGTPLLVGDRPVYRLAQDEIFGDKEEAILFTGRRWYRTFWQPEELATVLDRNFHPYWDNVLRTNTYFVSDITDSHTPISVAWSGLLPNSAPYEELTEEVIQTFINDPYENFNPVVSSFECSNVDCESDDNPCGSSGVCKNQTCICRDFSGGYFCEYRRRSAYSRDQFDILVDFVGGTVGQYVDNTYHQRYWAYQDLGFIDDLI